MLAEISAPYKEFTSKYGIHYISFLDFSKKCLLCCDSDERIAYYAIGFPVGSRPSHYGHIPLYSHNLPYDKTLVYSIFLKRQAPTHMSRNVSSGGLEQSPQRLGYKVCHLGWMDVISLRILESIKQVDIHKGFKQILIIQETLNECYGGLVAKSCPALEIPWTVACQASLFMGFSRQEYWSGLPFPSPQWILYLVLLVWLSSLSGSCYPEPLRRQSSRVCFYLNCIVKAKVVCTSISPTPFPFCYMMKISAWRTEKCAPFSTLAMTKETFSRRTKGSEVKTDQ